MGLHAPPGSGTLRAGGRNVRRRAPACLVPIAALCLAPADGLAQSPEYTFTLIADSAADCNGDGSVNIFDFLCFQGAVTQGCG
jgi:hypothetical protein